MNCETVPTYRALWTGVGAQLARDVPFSAICWSTLEPVSLCLYTLDIFIICYFMPCAYCLTLIIPYADSKKIAWSS
jgi:hypothetical protein